MTTTRWWDYLQSLIQGQTQQEAAEKIGISKSNITRWKAGARADPEFVVKVAREYKVNVLRALVEAEFITEEEAGADIATAEFSYFDELSQATAAAKVATNLFEHATQDVRRFHAIQLGGDPEKVENLSMDEIENLIKQLRETDQARDELAARRSNKTSPSVNPIDDDELAEAIREANSQPRAAHPATEVEYTEPEAP